jgi:hypothetical protein
MDGQDPQLYHAAELREGANHTSVSVVTMEHDFACADIFIRVSSAIAPTAKLRNEHPWSMIQGTQSIQMF